MMKKFLAATVLLVASLFASVSASANGIDAKCAGLTYKAAPVVNADQYICHKQYAVAFSYDKKNPVYTTEYLAADHIGAVPRTDDFRVDPAVPERYRATPADYSGASCNGGRCDRGHMTPDQDFSATKVTTSESFFMTNMVPQNFRNNQIIWRMLETQIRAYVKRVGPVYVVTGPIYDSAHPRRIGQGVAVPDRLFKVVIDAKTGHSIAFLMPNTDLPLKSLPTRVVNLGQVEAAAGIVFDQSLEKTKVADYTAWFGSK